MDQVFIDNFLALAAIPRPSHREERVSRYLYERALARGLTAARDEKGNVVIDRPAAPGCENAPRAILQSHMDMVVVPRPGSDFDRLNDPVEVLNDGKSLRARRSSLGADDGAGVALIEELLEDSSLVCGPLRGIFTVDEEDGMSGAEAVTARDLDGKYLINIDWETAGSLCCSSAGSQLYRFHFSGAWEEARGVAYELDISGLLGGHSGTMIHTGRANALRVAAECLQRALSLGLAPRLAGLRGGTASNAIPAAAAAVVVIPGGKAAMFEALMASCEERFRTRYGALETGARFGLRRVPQPDHVLSISGTASLLDFLSAAVIGVNTMSGVYPGLVESSANLSEARADETGVWCDIYQRSSSPEATEAMLRQYEMLAMRNGARMEILRVTPAWPVRPGSRLMGRCTAAYRALTGRDMAVEPVHAGLECGAWAEKNPALDIISIGPEVKDIHSPEETLDLDSVELLRDLVRTLLEEIGRE